MPNVKALKAQLCKNIDEHKDSILEISHKIFDNPELGLQEYFASSLLCDALAANGFEVKKALAGLETSFRADFSSKTEGPRVALIAEYDALPDIGHGCGHNIIGASAVGAAVALKEIIEETGGSICVIGSPAEETVGGKINLLDAGIFDDCDFAMMVHPCAGEGVVGRAGLACAELSFVYYGQAAHSASEHTGVNALTALINTFNNIASIRASFKSGQRVNGIIENGGTASNVIPGYARAAFCTRADTLTELKELNERIIDCAKGASLAVGVEVKWECGPLFAERYSNHRMDEVYLENMAEIGVKLHFAKPGETEGSSDIGNVSLKLPTVHEYSSVTDEAMNIHTAEYAVICRSERGDVSCINGAKGLAMLACDILCDAALREEIVEEFRSIKK